jgi:hypothetical protein
VRRLRCRSWLPPALGGRTGCRRGTDGRTGRRRGRGRYRYTAGAMSPPAPRRAAYGGPSCRRPPSNKINSPRGHVTPTPPRSSLCTPAPARSPGPVTVRVRHGRRGLLARDPVPLAARVESAARPRVAATTDAVPSRSTRSRKRTGPQFQRVGEMRGRNPKSR